jgi:3-isopropylmalate dehydrogenase
MTSVLLLPGDGIGPEIAAQVTRLVQFFNAHAGQNITLHTDDVGGTAYDKYGKPCADHTLAQARVVDAVLLGAVGGPKWDNLPFDDKPERGLLRLRKELDLFANLRPALCFDALAEASTLKPEVLRGTDLLIVRELTGGVYFAQPRGITNLPDGQRQGLDSQSYTTSEIWRVGRVAFDAARKRNNRLVSCDKANVMHSGVLWREEITKLHAAEYADVQLSHMYADNAAMQLVRNPRQFVVVVTDNLFGDLLSDVAAMITGSLGMLPSASLGAADANGKRAALYEPVHGSAPDIAGQGIANPCGMILSLAMALRYSLNNVALAQVLEQAVQNVLGNGLRTADIFSEGATRVSTDQMGAAIEAACRELLA